jgi:alpha-tubulin suppressor-like RCC1 family protein
MNARTVAALMALMVSACGGGDGGGNSDGSAAVPPAANVAPVASFTATPSSGTVPLTVQFDASASKDSDGSIASYGWNFGDGSAAGAGVTATHVFQSTGTYTVTLTVTDNRGATASSTRQVSASQATGPAATLSKIATIDNGDMTVCAVGVDGKAWCWGQNNYGQLGTGDTVQAFSPRVAAEGFAFSKVSVSNGGAFACGITIGGTAYCWGSQEGGRLGDGTMAPSGAIVTAPVPVSGGRKYRDIAAGGDHACAVAEDGAAFCWGHNERGQLGTGSAAGSAVPAAVAGGLLFTTITAHQMVSCGTAADGTGYCWGNGSEGNLGTGSKSSSNVPAQVKGGLKFSSLQLGIWTACGVTNAGEGYCWGSNWTGELGIGSKTPAEALEPLKVAGGYTWKSIAPGVAVTCGVTTEGRGYCWGGNAWGERGAGPFPAPDVTSPVPVAGDLTFQSIDADWCSCGVADNVAYCWGLGKEGCIGDGGQSNRGVPTRVAGQP